MSKYDALGTYLSNQVGREIPVTFAEIERVIGFSLPPVAQQHRAWWSNNPSNNVMTKVWLAAGFESEQVDMAGRKLVFKRKADVSPVLPTLPSASPGALAEPPRPFMPPREKVARHPALGALKGMFSVVLGHDFAKSDPAEVAEWESAIDRKAAQYEAGRHRK